MRSIWIAVDEHRFAFQSRVIGNVAITISTGLMKDEHNLAGGGAKSGPEAILGRIKRDAGRGADIVGRDEPILRIDLADDGVELFDVLSGGGANGFADRVAFLRADGGRVRNFGCQRRVVCRVANASSPTLWRRD